MVNLIYYEIIIQDNLKMQIDPNKEKNIRKN